MGMVSFYNYFMVISFWKFSAGKAVDSEERASKRDWEKTPYRTFGEVHLREEFNKLIHHKRLLTFFIISSNISIVKLRLI